MPLPNIILWEEIMQSRRQITLIKRILNANGQKTSHNIMLGIKEQFYLPTILVKFCNL